MIDATHLKAHRTAASLRDQKGGAGGGRGRLLGSQRHRIENAFACPKDWRRIGTRYDRCLDLFLSACASATVVLFWL